MAVSKRLRYEVLRRDNHTCRYCGSSAPDVKLTVDHVTPTTLGGSDDPSNLVAACVDCNSGKSATPPGAPLVEDVKHDAVRWRTAMEHLAAVEHAKHSEREDMLAGIHWYWDYLRTSMPYCSQARMDSNWQDTVERWLDLGMTEDDVMRSMRTAMSKTNVSNWDMWRYTCGIMWNLLTQRQEAARTMLNADDLGSRG